jgi:hypothetical protein
MTGAQAFKPNGRSGKDQNMADQPTKPSARKLKSSREIYEESIGIRPQVDDGQPRQSEDDQQREQLGPRGVPGEPDPAKMVPQRRKKTPSNFDPGHTA